MFSSCDFLLGQNQTVVIVLPVTLPHADTYTVSVSDGDIKFRAGWDNIAEITYPGGEIFRRIAGTTQVGLVESPPPDDMPPYITNVAYVEVRKGVA